jgi:hypothetical protein
MKKRKKMIFLIITIIALLLIAIYVFKIAKHYPRDINLKHEPELFGVTYSKKYAESIGLDWKEAYIAILDELGVKKVRIPVYWDDIEKSPGVFDFGDYDFLIKEAEKRDVKIVLNFGMRVARWPECHFPDWANNLNTEKLQDRTLKMLSVVVENFKNSPAIVSWQLENEPLLNSFGVCPRGDYNFLKKELDLVKKLDNRPVMISATGELSFWLKEGKIADIFGTTMYRVVHNPIIGYVKYPYPSSFYRFKARLAGIPLDKAVVIELQAEPWIPKEDISNIYDTNYQKSFNLNQFEANVQFAINTGFKEVYLWGVEWWYFKHKIGGNSSYWDFAKTLFP